MKVIISNAGTVALRVSADDSTPTYGVMARNVIEFVSSTYQFSVKPNIPSGIPPLAFQHHFYQSGMYLDESGQIWPIIQFSMIPNGDIVTASNTDAADKILSDITAKLDAHLGYRFATAKQERFYHSIVVAQFDPSLENLVSSIGRMETFLNKAIPRPPDRQFKIKRLGFGFGDPQQLFIPNTVEAIETADFLIERRSAEPYSENRYFCSGPVRTQELEAILAALEDEFRQPN